MSRDRDSLVALDALLKIRASAPITSSQTTREIRSPVRETTLLDIATPLREKVLSNPLVTNLGSPILPMGGASALLRSHQAAVAATSAHLQMAMAHATASNSQVITPVDQKRFRSNSSCSEYNIKLAPAMPVAPTESPQPESSSIRLEKVEAALRSKPQRGRKRDDLSEKERLELTRTRNREHAKTTRIRKKARYQELLECEQRYLRSQRTAEVDERKKQCVVDFLLLRQEDLNLQLGRDHGNKSVQEDSSNQTSSQDSKISQLTSKNFQFDCTPLHKEVELKESAREKMIAWDKALLQSINSALDRENLPGFQYEIDGDKDGVALNQNGDAFCNFTLSLLQPDIKDKTPILSGVAVAKFTTDGEAIQMRCLRFTILEKDLQAYNTSPDKNHAFAQDAQRGCLGSNLVHPSTVSLDVKLEDSEDTGMPIV